MTEREKLRAEIIKATYEGMKAGFERQMPDIKIMTLTDVIVDEANRIITFHAKLDDGTVHIWTEQMRSNLEDVATRSHLIN